MPSNYKLMTVAELNELACPAHRIRIKDNEINAIKVGDYIKIVIHFDPLPRYQLSEEIIKAKQVLGSSLNTTRGERPWGRVNVIKTNSFEIEINNDMIFTEAHGIKCGDVITVKKEHITKILID